MGDWIGVDGVGVTDFSDTLLSHEWLAPRGGSENVFEQLVEALPGSALRCLWNDAPERFGDRPAESWLAHTPIRRSKALALPLLPGVWRAVDLAPFERVVASSHAFGHQLAFHAAQAGKRAFSYIHTPARYVWNPELDERGQRRTARAVASVLRHQDRKHTSEKVLYAANSKFVRDRIRLAWGRDATVIYPPVAVERIQSRPNWSDSVQGAEQHIAESLPEAFVLGASRLIEYKRLDLVMRCGEALDLPVVIAGQGPHEARLRSLASTMSVPVTFTGNVSNELLYALYQRATLFVFMAIEDFGIMPVEAMATGTPVLVNSLGGAAESVALLCGGATVRDAATSAELRDAALRATATRSDEVRRAASVFDESTFRATVRKWVESAK